MSMLVVLCSMLALAAAKPAFFAPGIFAPGLSYPAPLAYSPLLAGPLSLAPGQPANILGADGRPLDTLDVNVARAQHYAAKINEATSIHVLKKRSLSPLLYAPISHRVLTPLPLAYHSPLTYHAPLAYSYAAPSLIRTW